MALIGFRTCSLVKKERMRRAVTPFMAYPLAGEHYFLHRHAIHSHLAAQPQASTEIVTNEGLLHSLTFKTLTGDVINTARHQRVF